MKTHYDVLEVDKNCSAEQIRESYIKLSKQYHPDRNKNSDAHKRFVQVNEAYSVLGKNESRIRYDESLYFEKARRPFTYHSYQRAGAYNMNYYDYMHHSPNFRARQESQKNYPNFTISKLTGLLCCCLLIVIGTSIHLSNYNRKLEAQSRSRAQLLAYTKGRAERVGRENAIKDYANGVFRGVTMSEVQDVFRKHSEEQKKK